MTDKVKRETNHPARTRFAPSPTGRLHLGSVRTALFNVLFARHYGGAFILRMEDTDTVRSRPEFEQAIMEDLSWLGLDWDEGPDTEAGSETETDFGPYRQSERIDTYNKYAKQLLDSGLAYHCYCSKERLSELKKTQQATHQAPRYDGRCSKLNESDAPDGVTPVVRFRVPGKNTNQNENQQQITFTDGVFSKMSFERSDIGDFIIVGSDGVAGYNFAVVLDDALMKITHVIRGDDHLSNTARQILIFEALGFRPPEFMHLPMVLAPDKTPLGKRHAQLSVSELRKEGFLPLAILNAAAALGNMWKGGEKFRTLDEMAADLTTSRISKTQPVFDPNTLKRFGRLAMEKAGAEELLPPLAGRFAGVEPKKLFKAIACAKQGTATVNEVTELLTPLFSEAYLAEATEEVKKTLSAQDAPLVLECLGSAVKATDELTNKTAADVMDKLSDTGLKGAKLFMPIRAALTGRTKGLQLQTILTLLGREEVLKRLASVTEGN